MRLLSSSDPSHDVRTSANRSASSRALAAAARKASTSLRASAKSLVLEGAVRNKRVVAVVRPPRVTEKADADEAANEKIRRVVVWLENFMVTRVVGRWRLLAG